MRLTLNPGFSKAFAMADSLRPERAGASAKSLLLDCRGVPCLRTSAGNARLTVSVPAFVQGDPLDGMVLLPRDKFAKMLSCAGKSPVYLDSMRSSERKGGKSYTLCEAHEADTLRIYYAASSFHLPWFDPSLYPFPESVPAFPEGDHVRLLAADVLRMIDQTLHATDPDSTRYALGGISIEGRAGVVRFVATDGRTLALSDGKSNYEPVDGTDKFGLFPSAFAKVVKGLIDPDNLEASVQIGQLSHGVLSFRSGDWRLDFPETEGRFPDVYQSFADKSEGVTIARFPTVGGLLNAVQMAAICTDRKIQKGIDWHIDPGRISLQASAADVGESKVNVDAFEVSGEIIHDVILDAGMTLDVLSQLPPDSWVEMEFVSDKLAVRIVAPDFQALLMPMTREKPIEAAIKATREAVMA